LHSSAFARALTSFGGVRQGVCDLGLLNTPKSPAAPQLSNRIIEFGVAAALRMKLRCAPA
jgi:hypothetical protein